MFYWSLDRYLSIYVHFAPDNLFRSEHILYIIIYLFIYTGCPKESGTRINNYVCVKNEIRVWQYF